MKDKVTVTKEELTLAMAKATNEVAKYLDLPPARELALILEHGLVTTKVCEIIFKDDKEE